MTEYELTDVLYTVFGQMSEGAALYFTLVSAYIAMSFFIGERLTKAQLVVVNTLYVVWMTGVINSCLSGLGNAVAVTQALESMNSIIATQGPELISFSVYSFAAVQFGGVLASLYFMWSIRHPKAEWPFVAQKGLIQRRSYSPANDRS